MNKITRFTFVALILTSLLPAPLNAFSENGIVESAIPGCNNEYFCIFKDNNKHYFYNIDNGNNLIEPAIAEWQGARGALINSGSVIKHFRAQDNNKLTINNYGVTLDKGLSEIDNFTIEDKFWKKDGVTAGALGDSGYILTNDTEIVVVDQWGSIKAHKDLYNKRATSITRFPQLCFSNDIPDKTANAALIISHNYYFITFNDGIAAFSVNCNREGDISIQNVANFIQLEMPNSASQCAFTSQTLDYTKIGFAIYNYNIFYSLLTAGRELPEVTFTVKKRGILATKTNCFVNTISEWDNKFYVNTNGVVWNTVTPFPNQPYLKLQLVPFFTFDNPKENYTNFRSTTLTTIDDLTADEADLFMRDKLNNANVIAIIMGMPPTKLENPDEFFGTSNWSTSNDEGTSYSSSLSKTSDLSFTTGLTWDTSDIPTPKSNIHKGKMVAGYHSITDTGNTYFNAIDIKIEHKFSIGNGTTDKGVFNLGMIIIKSAQVSGSINTIVPNSDSGEPQAGFTLGIGYKVYKDLPMAFATICSTKELFENFYFNLKNPEEIYYIYNDELRPIKVNLLRSLPSSGSMNEPDWGNNEEFSKWVEWLDHNASEEYIDKSKKYDKYIGALDNFQYPTQTIVKEQEFNNPGSEFTLEVTSDQDCGNFYSNTTSTNCEFEGESGYIIHLYLDVKTESGKITTYQNNCTVSNNISLNATACNKPRGASIFAAIPGSNHTPANLPWNTPQLIKNQCKPWILFYTKYRTSANKNNK